MATNTHKLQFITTGETPLNVFVHVYTLIPLNGTYMTQ